MSSLPATPPGLGPDDDDDSELGQMILDEFGTSPVPDTEDDTGSGDDGVKSFFEIQSEPESRIWIIRLMHARPTRDQLAAFFREFSEVLNYHASPRDPVALLFDLRLLASEAFVRLKRLLREIRSFMEIYRDRANQVTRGAVVWINSTVVKHILNVAMKFMVREQPVVFSDVDDYASVHTRARRLLLATAR